MKDSSIINEILPAIKKKYEGRYEHVLQVWLIDNIDAINPFFKNMNSMEEDKQIIKKENTESEKLERHLITTYVKKIMIPGKKLTNYGHEGLCN